MKVTLLLFLFVTLLTFTDMAAQEDAAALPYHEIPAYPEAYTPGAVVARFIDGLGYRYYWATEGLRPEDLTYEPGNEGRNAGATVDHVYDLSVTIVTTARQEPNIRPAEQQALTFEEKRKQTLLNLREAADLLRATGEDLRNFDLVFQRGEQTATVPFWHLLNGQISDALYHTGQIVTFRRSAGNPMDARVNVFTGKNRE